jgi:hypothetical protein
MRAALWAAGAVLQARWTLRSRGICGATVRRPPRLPVGAVRGVHAVLRRSAATCLERSLVLQRWEQAQGRPRAVVIGVQAPGPGFAAHAWLDGAPDRLAPGFHELLRLPARG